LLARKEVAAVSPTEAFPKASPTLQVLVVASLAAACIPGPALGKEWWKLDLEAVVVTRIQLEVAVVT
jgi:hypothetical protein